MEKTKTVIMTIERIEHKFYCDRCGKHLGTSQEDDDRYFEKFGSYTNSIRIGEEWYYVKKNFCDECEEKYLTELAEVLKDFGFNKSTCRVV